jgi:2-polyprenyl-6-hydroxyphenyl methylase/3-demethylubiquinone-9 3-methyltransferase
MAAPRRDVEFSELERAFAEAGGTAWPYLRDHYARFVSTKREYDSGPARARGVVLDIGAHWLHQSVLWAMDGWRVVALDVPVTFELECVRNIAARHDIRLLPNVALEKPAALAALETDSVDTVLFTEIIEHLAFNPVSLWREIHRVLRPTGTVIVTTPNYYALRGRAWAPLRFASGRGGGLTTRALVGEPTFAHHWKEYSRAELRSYFAQLSPDFRVDKARLVGEFRPERFTSALRRSVLAVEEIIPALRPNLHFEIGLHGKSHGVVAEPGW